MSTKIPLQTTVPQGLQKLPIFGVYQMSTIVTFPAGKRCFPAVFYAFPHFYGCTSGVILEKQQKKSLFFKAFKRQTSSK
jgi:hypothetical protein